jgi:hypothetical protein
MEKSKTKVRPHRELHATCCGYRVAPTLLTPTEASRNAKAIFAEESGDNALQAIEETFRL